MNHPDCYVIERILATEEIMAMIAGAETLVCTSLHGSIIGCLSGVRLIVFNMYSSFVSKMDGLADWLGSRNLLVDNIRQLKAALAERADRRQGFPVQEIKKALAVHFDQMAQVILNRSCAENICVSVLDKALNFDRSFLEWRNVDGKLSWRTIISASASDTYQIDEDIDHDGEVTWAFKTMEFLRVEVDSLDMVSMDVDENGGCYNRTTEFMLKSTGFNVRFAYRKIYEKQTDAFNKLLQSYWNKSAHVELLEQSERRHIDKIQDTERDIARLLSENGALSKENNALKMINAIELETNAHIKSELDSLEAENVQLKDNQKQLMQTIVDLRETLSDNNRTFSDLQQTIRNKEGHIELLLETEREYEREKHSRTYRTALVFRKISIFFLPVGSRRRFFFKLLAKGMRHPIRMMRMINPRRIKNCFTILRTEGTESASVHLRLVEEFERSGSVDATLDKLDVAQIERPREEPRSLEDYPPILFTLPEEPLVSIIIPAYNQFDYTYRCLESIQKHSEDVAYEILLADDCSTDLTVDIDKIVTGIRHIRNQENLRFLLSCNNAARQARGEYILFLNNDTQVQAGWLQPLVGLMESDASIGITGSKLVYPDGHLQEAGGIMWKDASAWNYGHMQNPEDPEYSYAKETDYISGAALMIRRSLWTEIGGFDERYVPAYNEDSDLAFEVRRHGYKVVYQPLSVVVHFEGISNGTDLTAGQKRYQILNQEKFRDKWRNVLETEHFPNGESVFLARDRGLGKKHVLVIDHYVPQYDKDAGSKTTFMYLKMLASKGYHLTFLGDNFYRHEPYTTELQQMGVFVLYGPRYAEGWKEWLAENMDCFDIFYLNRPHIAIKYIDFIKDRARGKIIYYGHDLHFLRTKREYELTGDVRKLEESRRWLEQETYLLRKADMNYYPSAIECDAIRAIDPSIPVKAITAYVYEHFENASYEMGQREGLLFVGGFGHDPNLDAVLWFVESIYPEVHRRTGAPFYIVGSKAPEAVTGLKADGVVVKGFISEEELARLYHSARIAVVPLRYGAGVKGKVVEALYYGIPLVTTSVGTEGISGIEDAAIVRDSAQDLIDAICSIYADAQKLSGMSREGLSLVRQSYSTEAVWNVIKEDF